METKSNYSFKEPIIEYSIGGAIIIAWIVLVIITGFYWGYLFILIIPAYFLIDGILTHKRIINYKKQEQSRKIEETDTNSIEK